MTTHNRYTGRRRVQCEAQAKEEEARLETLLLEGLASKTIPPDSDFWKRMEAKTEAILDKHKVRHSR